MSGSGISWAIRKSAPRSRQLVPHHSSFHSHVGCPSCRPTNSVKALKVILKSKINKKAAQRGKPSSHKLTVVVAAAVVVEVQSFEVHRVVVRVVVPPVVLGILVVFVVRRLVLGRLALAPLHFFLAVPAPATSKSQPKNYKVAAVAVAATATAAANTTIIDDDDYYY